MKQSEIKGFDKALDAASYDPVAEIYGHYINRLSGPLAEHVVRLGELRQGQSVLDVGTGTGIAARYAARAVAPGGQVTGIDLSAGMIKAAMETALAEALMNVSYRVMDAELLAFPDRSFDAVTSLCAVAHFPALTKAMGEMRRVMKPGGRLVVAIGAGRPGISAALVPYAARRVLGIATGWIRPRMRAPGVMERFIEARVAELPQREETMWAGGNPSLSLRQHVVQAGFEDVRSDWVGHTVRFASAESFWEAQVAIITAVRKRLQQLPEDRVELLHSEFVGRAQAVLESGGELLYPYGAYFITGVSRSAD